MAGSALVVVGFATAADHGFGDKTAIGCIGAGAGTLVFAIVNCILTKRNAIIPAVRSDFFFPLWRPLNPIDPSTSLPI